MSSDDLASWRDGLHRTLDGDAWRAEGRVVARHRRALMFLLAGLICVGAFVQPSNGYIAACFGVLAVFCAVNGLRLGLVLCLIGALRWGLRSREVISHDDEWDEALMLAFLAALILVLVWKADEHWQVIKGSDEPR